MSWVTDLFDGIPLPAEANTKLEVLEGAVTKLESENGKLKVENQKLKDENQKLKDELAEMYKTKRLGEAEHRSEEDEIDEPKKSILVLFGFHGDEMSLAQLKRLLREQTPKLHAIAVDYYVQELCGLSYIVQFSSGTEKDPRYRLQQRGREYLVKNDLLPPG